PVLQRGHALEIVQPAELGCRWRCPAATENSDYWREKPRATRIAQERTATLPPRSSPPARNPALPVARGDGDGGGTSSVHAHIDLLSNSKTSPTHFALGLARGANHSVHLEFHTPGRPAAPNR